MEKIFVEINPNCTWDIVGHGLQKRNISIFMALFVKIHISLSILLFYSQALGAEYQFKDNPNKIGQFNILCDGLIFPENSAFDSAVIQISKLYESSDEAMGNLKEKLRGKFHKYLIYEYREYLNEIRNFIEEYESSDDIIMLNPKEKLRKKFQKYGISGYGEYLNKIRILMGEARMARKEGETLSRAKDYTTKDLGVNARTKFVSQESARRKGEKLISDGNSYMEEAQKMRDILNEYVQSRKVGKLTREWKSAKGESVYGTVLELKDGKITFVSDKTRFFTFEESILDKDDIKFLYDNIILLDVLDIQDSSLQPENVAEILERTQRAYENGNAYAAYVLALAYKSGYGVKMDWDTALKYMQKAAQNGIAEAQKNMGDYNYSNWGNANILLTQNKDATNIVKALEWYEKSAKNGNRSAMIMCAKILFPVDINKAYEWAIRAYNFKYEDENGCEILAVSLLGDIEMRRGNTAQAVKWYEMAAERNNLYAILKLADYYCSKGSYHKFLTYSLIADIMDNLNGNINLLEAMYWGWGIKRNLSHNRIFYYVEKTNILSNQAQISGFTDKYRFYLAVLVGFNYREIKYIASEEDRKSAIRILQSVRGKYMPIAAKALEMIQNGVINGEELLRYSTHTANLMF